MVGAALSTNTSMVLRYGTALQQYYCDRRECVSVRLGHKAHTDLQYRQQEVERGETNNATPTSRPHRVYS